MVYCNRHHYVCSTDKTFLQKYLEIIPWKSWRNASWVLTIVIGTLINNSKESGICKVSCDTEDSNTLQCTKRLDSTTKIAFYIVHTYFEENIFLLIK